MEPDSTKPNDVSDVDVSILRGVSTIKVLLRTGHDSLEC